MENNENVYNLKDTFYDVRLQALDKLPDRDRKIFLLRVKGLSLRKIGKKFGISRARVGQIEKRAKKKLSDMGFVV